MTVTLDEPAPPRLEALDAPIANAANAIMRRQNGDGHWVFELEADATIPAEYVLLRHYLGEEDDLVLERKIGVYLRRIQADHGGWPLYHGGAFDISASVKAYFALKMIGDDPNAPHMTRAREAILAHGGAAATNVFTRIQLALFNAGSWNEIPTMPVELILMPYWFPIHLSKMSYWARTVIVPLLVLQVKKPVAVNRRGVRVDELYRPAAHVERKSQAANASKTWAAAFGALDVVLKAADPLWPKKLRQQAIDKCVDFVTERLNGEDGLGAIYPAIANSVMMYAALGFGPEDPRRAIARRAVEKLLVVKDDEAYCQPCVSPVWDTALVCHTLLETGGAEAEKKALAGLAWLKPLQVLETKGDWIERRPNVRPGGWAFQYNNAHYPDLDDTAVVVMAMDRARKRVEQTPGYDEPIARAEEWVRGLQSENGGWGAFDADNTYHYLNNIPFADHGALLDPPTVDVSARCVSMLAQLGVGAEDPAMKSAISYLEKDQEKDGSFFGRWGVNYVYGTWSALCALAAAGAGPDAPSVARAADWLVSIQNPDGGWGESCDSYDLAYSGYTPAASRASQTAWAVLGLIAAGRIDHPATARGIAYLLRTQTEDGLWAEADYTGGGFPRVFYLRYHGYAKFFPLWALARYRNLKLANAVQVPFGM